ncbi:3,4-dihydroxy-2-butanone-4-phosphate synthase [Microcoleus sp. D3_18a_C4]
MPDRELTNNLNSAKTFCDRSLPGKPPLSTATVSIDAVNGVSTGIWAEDRARTIQVAIHPDTKPQDLRRPGHIFPLRAIGLITMCQLRKSCLTCYLEKGLRLGLG